MKITKWRKPSTNHGFLKNVEFRVPGAVSDGTFEFHFVHPATGKYMEITFTASEATDMAAWIISHQIEQIKNK